VPSSSLPSSPSPFQLAFAMSSTGGLGSAGAEGPGGSSGRKRGHPFGSKNKVKYPTATPPVPRKRVRPLGSRNKKTLAALVAADSARAAPAAAAMAPTRAVATEAAVVTPAGAVATTAAAVTPIKAAAAIISTAISVGAAPLALPLRASVARLAPPPTWCVSPDARRRSSDSPAPRSTGSPPSWPIFGLGARCVCCSPSSLSTPWGRTP
jgi:hypothetical protein